MAEIPRCRTCKHFADNQYRDNWFDGHPVCDVIDSRQWAKGENRHARAKIAQGVYSKEFTSYLWVTPEFGCVLHEPIAVSLANDPQEPNAKGGDA